MIFEAKNIKLIQCEIEILKNAIEGNKQLSQKLGVIVPEYWTEFGRGALEYSLDKLSKNENEKGWWTYLPIHINDNKLIGSGGFKGKPTQEGMVELGYEIMPEYRNQGFATEMTKALIEIAFKNKNVKSVIAHTLGQNNPSTKVLIKCGFNKVEEINDPDDGLIWKWEFNRKLEEEKN